MIWREHSEGPVTWLPLMGEIDPGFACMFIQSLATVPEGDRVAVSITSNGGANGATVAILDALARMEGGVTTICMGATQSAAVEVFLAGDRRYIETDSFLMIHSSAYDCFGFQDRKRAEQSRQILEMHDRAAARRIARAIGKPEATVWAAYFADGRDHYLTAPEAVAAGFAHAIYTLGETPPSLVPAVPDLIL